MRDVAGAAPRGSSRLDSKSISCGVLLAVPRSLDPWTYGVRDAGGARPRGSSRFDSKSISGGVSLDVTSSIDEWKYGRWYAARAAATAIALEASRLKNQTPGRR